MVRATSVILGTVAVAGAGVAIYLYLKKVKEAGKIGTAMVVTEAPPGSVGLDEPFSFSGYLEDEEGNKLAGKDIDLIVDGAVGDSVTTDSSGGWTFSVALTEGGSHKLYASFPGDSEYKGCGRTW